MRPRPVLLDFGARWRHAVPGLDQHFDRGGRDRARRLRVGESIHLPTRAASDGHRQQVAGGALLLIGRYIPLALTLLGPVIVNILLYHLLMDLKGIPMAIVVTILWGIVFYRHRQYFSGLFTQKTA